MKTILFLCSGNYYRSRFAEELFNHHAACIGQNWLAQSRGLAIGRESNNVGPLSLLVLKALEDRHLVARGGHRLPQQCTIADLERVDWIVALNESEHRPLLREHFPGWEARVDYWQVEDIGVAPADVALATIEREIEGMLGVDGHDGTATWPIKNARHFRRLLL